MELEHLLQVLYLGRAYFVERKDTGPIFGVIDQPTSEKDFLEGLVSPNTKRMVKV